MFLFSVPNDSRLWIALKNGPLLCPVQLIFWNLKTKIQRWGLSRSSLGKRVCVQDWVLSLELMQKDRWHTSTIPALMGETRETPP